jgi:alanyl-tRNA synthetase
MNGVNDIRSSFTEYFAKNGHEPVASGPLVPRNDPTLMFTSAGMVQFKNVFTGLEKRSYQRAVTAQKCLRAGGKHNDLDNVGYTSRHHTFFEMLGNFSFGDYFKERAIELAWKLITGEFGLPPERLIATVYSEDDEAYSLWRKIAGLPESRIIRIATSDNFWAMGDTGPCGPCSEIFYDHGESIPGGPPGSPDEDGDRFIEIWNLVFMQYEQFNLGERVDLPRPSIDTGMGLERIAAVLQGVHDNYDIDLFKALIAASEEATGVPARGSNAASHRVMADHLRATSFLIADGVLPSNEGRGYVLRRIMRRAMRHGSLLGARDPLMHRLVPALVREMGGAYPELARAESLINETLLLEETRFRKTLERGLVLLEEASANLREGDRLSGETAFKLYDTYGFPLDLTQDALKARGITVDTEGFSVAMERQRAEARASWAGSGDSADEAVWFAIQERAGVTDFLGYDTEIAEGMLQAIVSDGAEASAAEQGRAVALVFNQTPFYAESGGQTGDSGEIRFENGSVCVSETKKKGDGLHVHFGVVVDGQIAVGEAAELEVDHRGRSGLRQHHSATHILHEALRQVLGPHVMQKGSLVAPDRLRFDFAHPRPVTPEEIAEVEKISNEIVQQSSLVETRLMDVDQAIEAGAMALFGEKYGDEVRVVTMGRALRGARAGMTYSMELCGGTHVHNTGEIGLLHIIGESAVGAGIRRIEALTGSVALRHFEEQERRIREISGFLKVAPQEAVSRVETLLDDRKRLEKELTQARKQLAMGGNGKEAQQPRVVNGISFLPQVATGVPPKELKGLVDEAKSRLGSGIAMVVSTGEDGKAAVVVGVTDDLTSANDAVELVRAASQALGGKGGGGRPDMAQAGGPDGGKAQQAIDAVEKLIRAS